MQTKTTDSTKLTVLTLAIALGVVAISIAQDGPPPEKKAKAHAAVDVSKLPPAADKKGVTYAGDIKAIFDTSCIKCHGGEKPKAKLSLETLESSLKGAAGGKTVVIVPGKSAESTLVHGIAFLGDEDHFMPPPNNKAKIASPLTKEQIGLIRAWIDQGAK